MEETKNPTTPEAAAAPSAPAPRPAPRPASFDGPRGPRPERNGQQRRGSRFGPRPPKVCPFCSQKVKYIDYKAGDQLRRYLTDKGKIKARRKIGTCAKHQRRLALAIKRARHVALLPFTTESTRGE
jgi:small subunit ribosomal protein S18